MKRAKIQRKARRVANALIKTTVNGLRTTDRDSKTLSHRDAETPRIVIGTLIYRCPFFVFNETPQGWRICSQLIAHSPQQKKLQPFVISLQPFTIFVEINLESQLITHSSRLIATLNYDKKSAVSSRREEVSLDIHFDNKFICLMGFC